MKLTLRLFTKKSSGKQGNTGTVLNWRSPNDKDKVSGASQVIFIIHGFLETWDQSQWIGQLKDSYLAKDPKNKVIIVDWAGGANGVSAPQGAANTRIVGAVVGQAILNWGILSKTLLVGFSMGGQAMSAAGRYVQKYSNGKQNQMIPECIAIDPAGVLFDGCPSPGFSLYKTDCSLVEAIHTSSPNFGTPASKVDFKWGSYIKR